MEIKPPAVRYHKQRQGRLEQSTAETDGAGSSKEEVNEAGVRGESPFLTSPPLMGGHRVTLNRMG